MSFRRFVHLVVDDVNIRRTYSLRNIDMSPLFRSPVAENQNMEPSPLPDPVMSFCPPRGRHHGGMMNFMLLGGKHNKVVATDQTGRAVLYDPHSHAVTTLRGFAGPKSMPVALTINDGGDHLYVLDTHPDEICCVDTSFECLEFDDRGMDEDWYPRVLPPPPPPPPPPPHNCDDDPSAVVDSCAVSGDGSRIWVTDRRSGTYAFDTATEAWSKAGDWALPFAGAAEHVPKLGLWFGLRDKDRCELCAVDLAPTAAPAVRGLWTDLTPATAPVVRGLWTDLTPPPEWPVPPKSRLVHLGGARFCIARFFTDDYDSCCFPVTHAVFTAVEVERCADDADDGGLRMVKHGSKLFTLLDDMSYWVL